MVRFYFPKPNSKLKANDCFKLSVYDLYKNKTLVNGNWGTLKWTSRYRADFPVKFSVSMLPEYGFINLSYTLFSQEKPRPISYPVYLITTPCNYGKHRFWFICPLTVNDKYCGKRVATLYKPPSSSYFGCRHCHNLTYRDRNLSGWNKKWGNVLTHDELMELEDSVKKFWYKGKATKKYKKFLKQSEKAKLFWKSWGESMRTLREEITTLRYRK